MAGKGNGICSGVPFPHTSASAVALRTAFLAFVALLVCSGSISKTPKSTSIDTMAGLASRMPGLFVVFLVSALWLSGLPPFGNFFGKYLLGLAAEEVSPFLPLIITTAAILTLGYFLRAAHE